MFDLSAETQKLIRVFRDAGYGAQMTYDEIVDATGVDLRDNRSRVYTANRALEREHRMTLVNVRGVGYRVAKPNEHVVAMATRRKRAGLQIEKAAKTGKATNVALLDTHETHVLADALVWVSRVEQAISQHDARLERIETKLGIRPSVVAVDGTAEAA